MKKDQRDAKGRTQGGKGIKPEPCHPRQQRPEYRRDPAHPTLTSTVHNRRRYTFLPTTYRRRIALSIRVKWARNSTDFGYKNYNRDHVWRFESRCASAREARTQDVEWAFDHAVSRGPSCRSPDGRTEPDRPTRDGRCHDLYVKLIHVPQRLAYAMWAASNGTWPRQENLPRRPRLIQREDEDVFGAS